MSRNSVQGARKRPCVGLDAEPLEARALLSGIVKTASLRSFLRSARRLPPALVATIVAQTNAAVASAVPMQSISILTPGQFVTVQNGAIDVTVVRRLFTGVGAAPSSTVLNDPLTVNVTASLNSVGSQGQGISNPDAATASDTLGTASVTFPAGVMSENVQIPINAEVPINGTVPIAIAPEPAENLATAAQNVYLVSGPDAIPPTITSSQLITRGRHPTGIAITFSKPMAPATVENVHNYVVSGFHKGSTFLNPLALVAPAGFFDTIRHYALKAADYDPATRTVTLIPRQPFEWSPGYIVQSPRNLAGHSLTDFQGNTLFDAGSGSMNGSFQIDVPRRGSAT